MMSKKILAVIMVALLAALLAPPLALAASVSLTLSRNTASPGDTVTASGTADPDTWVTIKGIDSAQSIVEFSGVKSDAQGAYSDTFRVPDTSGVWTIVAGYGSNVASQTLTITQGGAATVPVTGVSLNRTSLALTVGSTGTLVATVAPSDATNKSVTWTSDNEAVSTVDQNGKVTAVAVGTATITVTTADGNYAAACSVTVTRKSGGGSGGGGGGGTITVPSVQTSEATSVTASAATLNGSITASGGATITAYGFLWGADQNNLDQKKQVGTDNHSGPFQASLSSLEPETTYYFQAYATNSKGTTQGSLKQFTTAKEAEQPPQAPPTQPGGTTTFTDVPASHWASDVIARLNSLGYISGYPDGSFKPENQITRAEFVAILGKVLQLPAYQPATASFSDVSQSDWFYASVENAVYAGIVKGYGSVFAPNDPITREQMAVMIAKAAQIETTSAAISFTDSEAVSAWAKDAVAAVAQSGIIKGYPDGSFRPQGQATRAEAAAVIAGILK